MSEVSRPAVPGTPRIRLLAAWTALALVAVGLLAVVEVEGAGLQMMHPFLLLAGLPIAGGCLWGELGLAGRIPPLPRGCTLGLLVATSGLVVQEMTFALVECVAAAMHVTTLPTAVGAGLVWASSWIGPTLLLLGLWGLAWRVDHDLAEGLARGEVPARPPRIPDPPTVRAAATRRGRLLLAWLGVGAAGLAAMLVLGRAGEGWAWTIGSVAWALSLAGGVACWLVNRSLVRRPPGPVHQVFAVLVPVAVLPLAFLELFTGVAQAFDLVGADQISLGAAGLDTAVVALLRLAFMWPVVMICVLAALAWLTAADIDRGIAYRQGSWRPPGPVAWWSTAPPRPPPAPVLPTAAPTVRPDGSRERPR